MPDQKTARFPWGLTIAAFLAFALLMSLGTWQVQRLQWKQGLIARAEAAADLPPVPIMQVYRPSEEFRKVVVDCPGLATAPFVELRTIEDGQPGVRLISPCRLPNKPFVALVDRGFVAETISARPPVRPSQDPVQIIAELRNPPDRPAMALPAEGRRFFWRDQRGMARALGIHKWAASPMLFALTSSNPEWEALKPSAPPAAFSNNHLGYALTWFGLALALAGFYIALLRRKLKS
jgi:surfeit locus 1 family protein